MTVPKPPALTRVHRLDSVKLDATYFTDEGYLVDEPIVTSVGIFEYANPDGSIRRELRLPEYVFESESLASYLGKPIVITHRVPNVDKTNVEDVTVGTILSPGIKDGENVRAKIIIHDIDAVKRSGLRELSLGYTLDLKETPGVWNGQQYDAIQTDIRVNHLALVGNARAGDQARLNIDGTNDKTKTLKGGKIEAMIKKQPTPKPSASAALQKTLDDYALRKKRRLDEAAAAAPPVPPAPAAKTDESVLPGIPPEGSAPQTATAEERVQMVKDRHDRRDQEGDPATPEASKGMIAAQDEDIDELLKIIEELQAKSDFAEASTPAAAEDCENSDAEGESEPEGGKEGKGGGVVLKINADAMDRMISEHLELDELGRSLSLEGLGKMKIIDAKKAIVRKVTPKLNLDGKGETYINAVFESAKATIEAAGVKDCNYQRKQMAQRTDSRYGAYPTNKTMAAASREKMIARQREGGTK